MKNLTSSGIAVLLSGVAAFGQQPPQRPQPPMPPQQAQAGQRPEPPMPPPPPGERGMRPGPGGKWWDNPEIAKRVGITSDQKRKMDDVFVQSRMKLIDQRASVEKDQLTLESLLQGPALDDAKILPAVDKVAQDRAELEKTDARLLLGIRHILTPEQWTTLNQGPNPREERPERGERRGGMRGGMRNMMPGRGPGGPGGPPPPPQE